MSGSGAMSVTYDFYHLEGCTAGESLLCQEFAQTFVRCAAGVIFSAKPVALFSFAPTSAAVEAAGAEKSLRSALRELVRVYARELAPYGISLEALLVRGERTTLIAYREDLVAAVLADADDRAFLAAHGFATDGSRSLVRSMREKLAAYYRELAARPKAPADARPARAEFPHAMGVLFGYPLEDVVGFMNGARVTCRGPWNAYGDAEQARARFAAIAEVERGCRSRFRSGATLRALLQAA